MGQFEKLAHQPCQRLADSLARGPRRARFLRAVGQESRACAGSPTALVFSAVGVPTDVIAHRVPQRQGTRIAPLLRNLGWQGAPVLRVVGWASDDQSI